MIEYHVTPPGWFKTHILGMLPFCQCCLIDGNFTRSEEVYFIDGKWTFAVCENCYNKINAVKKIQNDVYTHKHFWRPEDGFGAKHESLTLY